MMDDGGMMMAGGGLWGLLLMIMVAAVFVVPFWLLLPKFGYSKWFALLAVFPLLSLILLWVLAFSEPRNREAT
ncbi:hypothetical protein [Jannaschia sp. W003]|uniref:hypothetical protein n=1 Tax=Jannaschia sp. W003 TaxID=2867012 RepID=UPI0021A624C4|nr:hypothetical protein [Jannaschia sp. W003]UWQ22827.1 hypothetical protein K3554_07335 [Jannaschia sp. W003]